ncbi:MAG: polysaccharide biosynthesis/export family protein [Thermodesulfobacteriota bacterium]
MGLLSAARLGGLEPRSFAVSRMQRSRSPFLHRGLGLLALLLAALLAACSQVSFRSPAAEPAATAPAPAAAPDTLRVQEFFLSAGDEIRISVFRHPELDREVRIGPDGSFFCPGVGQIAAAGRSLAAVQEDITAALAQPRPQRITRGDEVAVRVWRQDDLATKAVVASDGTLAMPLVGGLPLAGRTPAEAAADLRQALSRYLVDPQISVEITRSFVPPVIEDPQVGVEVLRYTGQKIFVLGEVTRPGVFLLEGETRLLQALAMAGGPTPDGELANVALLKAGGQEPPQLVDLARALAANDQTANPVLGRGDIVYVPTSTVADVDRFFQHLYFILRPVVEVESGIWLGQNIEAGARRSTSSVAR